MSFRKLLSFPYFPNHRRTSSSHSANFDFLPVVGQTPGRKAAGAGRRLERMRSMKFQASSVQDFNMLESQNNEPSGNPNKLAGIQVT